jgi:N-acetylglucosaminyl-diphospho-decaprenol L-rhamnosyltransferase
MSYVLPETDITSVDFVYVNYHSSDDVLQSILSLSKLLKGAPVKASVYIIDNSFVDSSPFVVKSLSSFAASIASHHFRVYYHSSDSNVGFGAACNKAVRFSTSPLIVFVNCDTSFHLCNPHDFLQFLSNTYQSAIAIAGPKVVSESGLLHVSCFSFDPISILLKPARHIRRVGSRITLKIPFYGSLKRRIDRITYEGMEKNSPTIVDWVSGCFMLVSRDFFEQVGGFDERYFMYFEDVDLCRKARQSSLGVIFDPRLTLVHRASHESARRKGVLRSLIFNPVARYHISSWIKYIVKWRADFWTKIQYILASPSDQKKFCKSGSGYKLDFSNYEPLLPDNRSLHRETHSE